MKWPFALQTTGERHVGKSLAIRNLSGIWWSPAVAIVACPRSAPRGRSSGARSGLAPDTPDADPACYASGGGAIFRRTRAYRHLVSTRCCLPSINSRAASR
jgi:hypothetical protein